MAKHKESFQDYNDTDFWLGNEPKLFLGIVCPHFDNNNSKCK